jgi:phage terminase large subunit
MDETSIRRLEDAGNNDAYYKDVYLNGNFGVLGDLVYPNWTEIYSGDIPKNNIQVKLGIDFGYSDALKFVIYFYDKVNKVIYVVDGLSFTKLADLEVFATAVKDKMIQWNINPNTIITGDSSDPRSGEVLRKYGLNMNRAIKGAGSKLAGIMFIKSYKMFVLDSCSKVKEALRIYVWKKDNSGIVTDDTKHDGSDILDAVRYSFENDLRGNTTQFGKM